MKKWKSWGAIDWDHSDAPDPDFALAFGTNVAAGSAQGPG